MKRFPDYDAWTEGTDWLFESWVKTKNNYLVRVKFSFNGGKDKGLWEDCLVEFERECNQVEKMYNPEKESPYCIDLNKLPNVDKI